MVAGIRPWGAACALVVGALAVGACKKSAPATASPSAGMADSAFGYDDGGADAEAVAEPEGEPRSFEELSEDLDRLGDELEGLRGEEASTPAEESCGRICAIAEATCDVSDQICGLAGAHEGETRYEQACDRAQAQCTDATDACDACSAS